MKYLKRFESLNDVKFCHNCGVELESSNKFCNECGEKQEESNTGSSNTLIKSLIMAKDGGTLNIDSNIGNFTVDKKIGTKTPYKITKPSRIKGNPNQIALDSEVDSLVNALEDYLNKNGSESYIQDYIDGIEDNRDKYSYPGMK